MKLPETPLEEIAKMLEYLVEVIEHEIPPPEHVDEAEQQAAFYLAENLRGARAMAWQLRRATEQTSEEQKP